MLIFNQLLTAVVIIRLGLSNGKSAIGYFWQINDIHLNLSYSQPQCNGRYGNYSCDSPPDLAFSALNATRQLLSNGQLPDFIVWAGDNGPHSKVLTPAELVDSIRSVSDQLQQLFPPDQVYILPTLGNHDVVPANQISIDPENGDRLAWCNKLGLDPHLWGPWIHRRSSVPTDTHSQPPYANFSTGCFFSHLLQIRNMPLLLISLNGLLWYSANPFASDSNPDPLGQLHWLNESFTWARKTNSKVLLVSHFPPGASENTPRDFQFLHPSFNKQFVQLIVKNADLIMAGLFAHTHVDSFRVVYNETNHPVLSLFTSPSVSPMRLRKLGSFNPRIRLYRYNRSSASLLGYSQYFLNLTSDYPPIWTLEYDTADAYKLPDLSPSSLSSLLDQFQRDDSLDGKWALYWKHELGGRPHEYKPDLLTPDGLCPHPKSRCRCEHLCPMRLLDFDMLATCLNNCSHLLRMSATRSVFTLVNENSSSLDGSGVTTTPGQPYSSTSSLPIIVGVIVVFLVILIGVVLIVNRETCLNRGPHSRRRLTGADRDGTVLFATSNGNIPHSANGLALPVDLDQFSDFGGGSSVELRTAFHPKYIADDGNSFETTHTSDEVFSHGTNANGTSPPINGSELRNKSAYLISSTFAGSPSPDTKSNGLSSRSAYLHRYSVPHTPDQRTPLSFVPTPGLVTMHNGSGDTVIKPNAPSSMMCHTEDYYADDEAFADEEDGPDLLLQPYGYSPTPSEQDGPLNEANQSFGMNHDHIPLTPTRPLKTQLFGKQSVDYPLCSAFPTTATLAAHAVGRQSVPVLSHSQSATLSGSRTDTLIPISHSAAVASPYRNGSRYAVLNADNIIMTNGAYGPEHRSPLGYDYVRT